jgi:NH3-dependent NAD+ synthetase
MRFFSFGSFVSKLKRTSTDFMPKSLHDKLKLGNCMKLIAKQNLRRRFRMNIDYTNTFQ